MTIKVTKGNERAKNKKRSISTATDFDNTDNY